MHFFGMPFMHLGFNKGEREREGFTVKVREMPFSNVQDFKTGLPFLYTLESFYVGLDSEIATYLIRDTTIKLVLTE